MHVAVAVLVGWSVPIVLRRVSRRLQSLLTTSTDIDSKPFRILHIRRKLLSARSVVLCHGSKTVLVAVRAAMGDSRG